MPEQESFAGKTFAHYRVLEKLGGGGMGVVHRAQDLKLPRQVALKFLTEELEQDKHALERFSREAALASKLNHQNVCTIHEISEHGGRVFIVMEFLEGKTLKYVINNKPLDLKRLLNVGIQIAKGLEAAHLKDIIHRDIKPANIFVTNDDQVKILDFGLAKYVGARKSPSPDETASTSGTGTKGIVGTLGYLSPEQARAEVIDTRSDIFSLGAVLYEMATGQHAFPGATSAIIYTAILKGSPIPAKQHNSQLPDGLVRTIDRALEKERDLRFQSAIELREELVGLKEGRPSPLPRPRLIRVPDSRPSLAVLPLVSVTNEPEREYFNDGVTESLINILSKSRNIKVMAWSTVSRFKGLGRELRAIGSELRVQFVLAGRITQRGDKEGILDIELVDSSDGACRWGEQFICHLKDVFLVQEKIAQAVSNALDARWSSKTNMVGTENAEAYRAYLMGRHHWQKRLPEPLKKSIELFQQAIDADPLYAQAHLAIADTYTVVRYYSTIPPKRAIGLARAALKKGLEIDDSLAEGYATLGMIESTFDWNWSAAERSFKRAIELNPNYPTSYQWFGFALLTPMKRHQESIAMHHKALELDPLSPIIHTTLGAALHYSGDSAGARKEFQATLELQPNFPEARFQYGHTLWWLGMHEEAIHEVEQANAASGNAPRMLCLLASWYRFLGKEEQAREKYQQLEAISRTQYVTPVYLAIGYGCNDEADKAMDMLEMAYEEHDSYLPYMSVAPEFNIVHDHPRFRALLDKLGLSEG